MWNYGSFHLLSIVNFNLYDTVHKNGFGIGASLINRKNF